MQQVILDTPDLKVTQETGDGLPMMHFQITLHLHPDWYEKILSGATSANVSIGEYVTECAKDGIARGYWWKDARHMICIFCENELRASHAH